MNDTSASEMTRASIARVYDAALGGTDNFEIDRQVLAQVREVAPEVNDLAWSNRSTVPPVPHRSVGGVEAVRAAVRHGPDARSGKPSGQVARPGPGTGRDVREL